MQSQVVQESIHNLGKTATVQITGADDNEQNNYTVR